MMIVNEVRNVCQALPKTVEMLLTTRAEESRAGDVLVAPCPVMTVYDCPRERVLFSPLRDANPWFHAVEALWMLAGRDDAATLDRYVKDFGEKYAEPDGSIHDAYGRRWRTGLGFDQLDAVVQRLHENPQDRQCVITMWDPRPATWDDMNPKWRGRPCNTHVYLRVATHALDMTICCRSNDMILGGHGANAVHFSVLQEYLAVRLGLGVGVLYQLSNNCHVYVSELERLRDRLIKLGGSGSGSVANLIAQLTDDRYGANGMLPLPMFDDPTAVDEDVSEFFARMDHGGGRRGRYFNTWFRTTLTPMMATHALYKLGKRDEAVEACADISSPDWRCACAEWLTRRTR